MTTDKIKGALFGLAIGDALGGTTEFMVPKSIKRRYKFLRDIIGGGVWRLEPGETTDDTSMTLAVAEGILAKPENPIRSIGKNFLKWRDTLPKDIGSTVRQAMDYYDVYKSWYIAAEMTDELMSGNSAGNGALMRTLPVALAYPDLKTMERITREQAEMTHYSRVSTETCLIYNRIAYDVLWRSCGLRESIRKHVRFTRYQDALLDMPMCAPTGYVVDTFTWVLWSLYNFDSYEEVVQVLANAGFDSDTTAAIAGGLKGLEVGFQKLPKRYVRSILEAGRLHRVSESLERMTWKLNR